MTHKKLLVLLAFVSVALVLVAGCSTTTSTGQASQPTPVPTNPQPQHDFKNGVYYFDETGAQFGIALAGFIGDHPELEFVSATGDDRCGYGAPCGYFVVMRKART